MGRLKKLTKKYKSIGHSAVNIAGDLGRGDYRSAAANAGQVLMATSSMGGLVTFQDSEPISKKGLKAGGLQKTGPGVYENTVELAKNDKSLDFNSQQLQLQANITADNKLAQDEEKKRRGRRNNILTKPLGALSSNGSVTRVLTGQ